MKARLRQYKSFVLTSLLTLGAASFSTAIAAEPQKGGTDILHLNLSKSIPKDDASLDVIGQVRLKYHRQGHSSEQSLELNVSSLDTTVPYHELWVWDGVEVDSGGEPLLKPVARIQPDANGAARIRYMSVETGNGNFHSLGKGKTPLPSELNPLSLVRQLVILETDGESTTNRLATATLENPARLNYLVKRNIGTETVPASLRIQANDQHGQFRLTANNLAPSTDYWLVLNGPLPADGGIEQVFTTDAKGKLTIRITIANPIEALALRKVQIRDRSEVELREAALTEEELIAELGTSLVLEVSLP